MYINACSWHNNVRVDFFFFLGGGGSTSTFASIEARCIFFLGGGGSGNRLKFIYKKL